MKKLLGAATIATAVALAAAPTASATSDETYFLSLQVARGWTIWDPAGHVAKAYTVCDELNYRTGDLIAPELMSYNPGWGYIGAGEFLIDAVTALCPWQDHTNDAPAPPQLQYAL